MLSYAGFKSVNRTVSAQQGLRPSLLQSKVQSFVTLRHLILCEIGISKANDVVGLLALVKPR